MVFVDQLELFSGKGPYDKGEEFIHHKGKRINTVLHSESYESYIDELQNSPSMAYTIELGYEHRPDAIANRFLGSPDLFWVILAMNNIENPFEKLTVGSKIQIPVNLPGDL
tara:strand:- start:309 stop:641 length:333 start_codon:yes stop_codon:yes gene_type:complete